MTLAKFPKTLLVVVAEAALERRLIADLRARGAQGYTVSDVRGAGRHGSREGVWEADRTIELKVICDPAAADRIAAHVMAAYGEHYHVALWMSEVSVLRPEQY